MYECYDSLTGVHVHVRTYVHVIVHTFASVRAPITRLANSQLTTVPATETSYPYDHNDSTQGMCNLCTPTSYVPHLALNSY